MNSRMITSLAALAALISLPAPAPAAPLDGSVPALCAVTSVIECAQRSGCERSSPEDAAVPTFLRVDVPQRLLVSVDGARKSPIAAVHRENGRLMIQGVQNARVWGAVIDEQTGQMSATVGEADGAIVLQGSCIAP